MFRIVLAIGGVALVASTAFAQSTIRVSVDSAGRQANSWSDMPTISDDGRFIAFHSRASNLVPQDMSDDLDVFVYDAQTGETSLVSIATNGANGHQDSGDATISGDGRFVAFASDATNLVPGDTNAATDVFVHDRLTGETSRVSVDSNGFQADGDSDFPVPSTDGRYVAFVSRATNLVPGDTNGKLDAFVHDRGTGATTRISVASDGSEGDSDVGLWFGGSYVSLSADGRFVAFDSRATNLVPGDGNANADVFVHDRSTGQTTRVSVDSAGHEADTYSFQPRMSADGRFIAFLSYTRNLVAGDTNGAPDVFLHDRATGETSRMSVDSVGGQGNGYSGPGLSISATGRFVAFVTDASNLVLDDTNGRRDVYLHDRESGETTRVSLDSAGRQPTSHYGSDWCGVSADGRFIAFVSTAGNLVPGDTNDFCEELDTCNDIFLRDREACADGTVNVSVGAPVSILRVGGRTGVVTLARFADLTVSLDSPPAGPSHPIYVLWIWNGFPSRQRDVIGAGQRLGCTVNPTPFDAALAPQPFACLHADAVAASACGTADRLASPARAPWSRTRAGFRRPTRVTLQGLVRDNSASNSLGVSVTNAVFVDVP
ncbi:MAG: PD40 domain-containing protein [Planctomycetes bacterium]|nr:PD40 domain-containing protein [Planctomycetota bacterium]MBI3848660.1 PD40 domain-containing protein [Planctomycetota bacterium]